MLVRNLLNLSIEKTKITLTVAVELFSSKVDPLQYQVIIHYICCQMHYYYCYKHTNYVEFIKLGMFLLNALVIQWNMRNTPVESPVLETEITNGERTIAIIFSEKN